MQRIVIVCPESCDYSCLSEEKLKKCETKRFETVTDEGKTKLRLFEESCIHNRACITWKWETSNSGWWCMRKENWFCFDAREIIRTAEASQHWSRTFNAAEHNYYITYVDCLARAWVFRCCSSTWRVKVLRFAQVALWWSWSWTLKATRESRWFGDLACQSLSWMSGIELVSRKKLHSHY